MKQAQQNTSSNVSHIFIVISSVLLMLSLLLVPIHGTQITLTTPIELSRNTPSADPPRLNLTYHTPANPTEIAVLSNSMIAGDHVTLRAVWSASLVSRSRLEVVAPAIPATIAVEQNIPTLEIDTKALGNNATCYINCTAWLTNGTILSIIYQNVYIGNYFTPKVTVLSPNGGEVWIGVNTIRWHAYDNNVDDTLHFDVRISSDSGVTFVTLVSSITQEWFDWNCSQYDTLDTYIVEIRATDGIYFSYDRSDSTFTVGEVPITTTTTTTTSTTLPDYRIITFVVVLMVSSLLMALIVYYVSRKWF